MRTRARSMSKKTSLFLQDQEEKLKRTDFDIELKQFIDALTSDWKTEIWFQRMMARQGLLVGRGKPWLNLS